jgi:alpha-beta hydrolase superfamily lysophospholipase
VLVGASLGGMIVRLYADSHLRDVGGMALSARRRRKRTI